MIGIVPAKAKPTKLPVFETIVRGIQMSAYHEPTDDAPNRVVLYVEFENDDLDIATEPGGDAGEVWDTLGVVTRIIRDAERVLMLTRLPAAGEGVHGH